MTSFLYFHAYHPEKQLTCCGDLRILCNLKNPDTGDNREVDMFGIGMPEMIIILIIILIVFGAGKLPEIGAGLGKGIKNFKKASTEEDKKPEQIEDNKNQT